MKLVWAIVVSVAAIMSLFLVGPILTGRTVDNAHLNEFSKCLSEKGFKMYGSDWNGDCLAQKEIFGNSFSYIDYINCDFNENVCNNEGIAVYPTWRFNGTSYAGIQQLRKLSKASGCELE